jgi:hypothetical protein
MHDAVAAQYDVSIASDGISCRLKDHCNFALHSERTKHPFQHLVPHFIHTYTHMLTQYANTYEMQRWFTSNLPRALIGAPIVRGRGACFPRADRGGVACRLRTPAAECCRSSSYDVRECSSDRLCGSSRVCKTLVDGESSVEAPPDRREKDASACCHVRVYSACR